LDRQVTQAMLAKERLRHEFLPARVRILFVGEAPPASGRFFYQQDSGLYRAVRDAFVHALPRVEEDNFLQHFQALGCYLVDLCGKPVDRLNPALRRKARADGEPRLAKMLQQFSPPVMITLVRAICPNVERSKATANWQGRHVALPYPGRWHQHRKIFLREITSVLRTEYTNDRVSKARGK